MNINSVTLNNNNAQVKPSKTAQQAPLKMKSLTSDQVSFTSKLPNNDKQTLIGIFGPPKVDKKVLKELVSIMNNDPAFEKPLTARNPNSDFPVTELRKEGKEIKIKMGFENSRGFYHKLDVTVNTDNAKLEFKSVDGLEYKEGQIKTAVNELFEAIIYFYKNKM